MKKIRINELARELEVKPNVILDLLPEFGVTEKKTHSSSVDEDVAILVKGRITGESDGGPNGARTSAPAERRPEPRPEVEEAPAREHAVETAPVAEPAPAPVASAPAAEAPAAAAPPADTHPAAHRAPIRPPVGGRAPLVPPIRTGGAPAQPPPGPSSPAHPPLAAPAPPAAPASAGPAAPPRPAPAQPAARPEAPRPVAPGSPAPPAPATAAPGTPLPRPAGPAMPRPGQILTGPRPEARPAILQGGPRPPAARPGAPAPPMPRPPAAPSMPMPPRPRPQQGAPQQQSQQGQQPGGPMRPPQQRPNLVGQPAARPVVPPNPAIVQRLKEMQAQPAKAMPGQPAAPPPRPGMPTRGQGLVPGRPIYPGPVRPGGPGGGYRPGGPGGPGGGFRPGAPGARGRGMHPTSPMLPPPPPGGAPDRRRAKPVQGREREIEEGKLRPTRRQETYQLPQIDREITISEGITVKELAEKLGVKVNLVVKRMFDKKIFATINQPLDTKLAEEVAREFGASINKVSYEEEATADIEQTEVEADRVKRPPVVTIMGHVDHGKTSLLDAIRATNVAGGEAGGITQHIGAYQVEKEGRKITFIDTPGHEAFTRMRARGAKVTDVVVLVVAADDGVMPQTLEAIDHAKAAKVPIVVAINKIDRPDSQIDRIKQQLADRGLLAEDWGGDTVMVPVSARAKTNIDLLLEMILLVSDLADLKANLERPAVGNVLEAKLDRGRGPVATVLVRNGTLRTGDFFICGAVFGKVRALFNDRGEAIKEAGPSTPVEVLGLESLPEVGDAFQVVTDIAKAKQIVLYRENKERDVQMAKTRPSLEKLHQQLKEGEVKELNIIIKADVGGTAEVLSDTLQKLSNDKVRIRVLRAGVGAINESDVLLASTSEAIIIGFNVRPERNAVATAEHEKVEMRLHTIIYELVDEVKRAMTGMLEPVFKEAYKGRAEVRETFRITKVGTVAGCLVQDGSITRDSQVRLLRDNVVVHTGKIDALKRFKNDASEVKQGFECGISLVGYNDIKVGDIIEAFAMERVSPEVPA